MNIKTGTQLYVLTNVSYDSVVAISANKETIIRTLRDELKGYKYLGLDEIEEMIEEESYDEYFTIDTGKFVE